MTAVLAAMVAAPAVGQVRIGGPNGDGGLGALTGLLGKADSDPPGSYRVEGSAVRISGRLEPMVVPPGGQARLLITATPNEYWHVYARADRDDQPGPGSKPTLIAFESTSGLLLGRPTTDVAIKTDDSVPGFRTQRYHEGPVTWTVPIEIPAGTPPGDYAIRGIVGYQACEAGPEGLGSCESPTAVRLQTTVTIGETASAAAGRFTFEPAKYNDAKAVAAGWTGSPVETGLAVTPSAEADSPATSPFASLQSPGPSPQSAPYDLERVVVIEPIGSLGYYMLLAFVGGIILNLMPCVLPVIGLKVMSFVEQAGKSRTHALVLNLWYAAGIISVFLLLGVLAAWAGLAWGGQFGNTAFNATLAGVVFAMALSLLGVWEIPIPGFFGRGSAQELAAKEGPLGAFLKGVITTVLATPCTGPFMAAAIAWAVTQSFVATLAVFASLGLGMASPYLVVGVWPELLRFLPKPGAWMETFKQLCGWVLIATVVFILSFIDAAAVVPTVLLLVGVGIACWLVARTPLTATVNDQLQTWALAAAVVLLASVVSFGWLYPDVMQRRFAGTIGSTAGAVLTSGGEWQPFTLDRLHRVAVENGRTVLVDFSAEWCATCKVLEAAVLHSDVVEQAIAEAEVVTMYGDFTDYPPEIEQTLRALKSNGVPVIAIFPGERPYEPIVFRGGYTKSDLVAALAEAEHRDQAADGVPVLEVSVAPSPLN
jgi:thiol:disulfide interchange protein